MPAAKHHYQRLLFFTRFRFDLPVQFVRSTDHAVVLFRLILHGRGCSSEGVDVVQLRVDLGLRQINKCRPIVMDRAAPFDVT